MSAPDAAARADRSSRNLALVCYAIAGLFLALWIGSLVVFALTPEYHSRLGIDYQTYMDAANRWLAGGPWYLPHQLAGPYEITYGDILYPPWAIPLFVAFTFLPAILWWAIPILGTAYVVWSWSPSPPAIAGIAVCLWFPNTSVVLISGNPAMWVLLAVALGTRWKWPSAFVLIKPTAAPFSLLGIRSRGWWLAIALQAGIALLLLPLTLDWVSAMVYSRNPAGLLYNVQELVMYMIPVLAWLGSPRALVGREDPMATQGAETGRAAS